MRCAKRRRKAQLVWGESADRSEIPGELIPLSLGFVSRRAARFDRFSRSALFPIRARAFPRILDSHGLLANRKLWPDREHADGGAGGAGRVDRLALPAAFR